MRGFLAESVFLGNAQRGFGAEAGFLGEFRAFARGGNEATGRGVVKAKFRADALKMKAKHFAGQTAVDRRDRQIFGFDQAKSLKRRLQILIEWIEEEIFGSPQDIAVEKELFLLAPPCVDFDVTSTMKSGGLASSQAR